MLIKKSTRKNKKYMAYVPEKARWLHFGQYGMAQYKDSTGVGLFTHIDHLDNKRRKRFFQRFAGLTTKGESLKKEYEKNGITPLWLSMRYLW